MARTNSPPLKNFHTDLDDARALGFADLVVPGPMFTCFFSEMFTRFFGERWITTGHMEFRLLRPVLANEAVAARARVTHQEPADQGVRVWLEIWCEREGDGARTSAGVASVSVEP